MPTLAQDAGEYRFTLRLNLAEQEAAGWWDRLWTPKVSATMFTLTLPWMSEQQLAMRRAIAMHAKDYRPTSGAVR